MFKCALWTDHRSLVLNQVVSCASEVTAQYYLVSFLFNTDARWAGKARTVTSVLLILGVFMVHVIALGNVTVSLDGVEYYAIKVMTVYCISQLTLGANSFLTHSLPAI